MEPNDSPELKRLKHAARMKAWRAKPENAAKHQAWSRRWKKNNPERSKQLNKESRKRRPEAFRRAAKKWRDNNPEKRLAVHRAWHARNPDADRKYYVASYTKDPRRPMLWRAKRRAREAKVPFDLEVDDFDMPDVCPVFGTPFAVGTHQNKHQSPSLDRLVPNLGYVKGNVRVISWRANTLKKDATLAEMRAVLRYMEEHLGDGTPQNSSS